MSQLTNTETTEKLSTQLQKNTFTKFLFDFFGRIITSSIGAFIGVSMFFAPFIPYIQEYLKISN